MIILTFNEERNISDCIGSVKGADEIIVLDSDSTDGTVEIARLSGAQVRTRAFTDFSSQRNFATSLARSDWVLYVDADERVTPELWDEVARVIAPTATNQRDGYLVPRLYVTFGRPLRHGGWYPQYHMRLQRRGKGVWRGQVHEMASVGGPPGKLREPLIHLAHPDVQTFLRKLDSYTTIEAARFERPAPILALMAVIVPPPYFVYKYVIQLGLLDGWRGLTVALLLTFYRCVVYLKALERRMHALESSRAHPR